MGQSGVIAQSKLQVVKCDVGFFIKKLKMRNEFSCLARAYAAEPQWWQSLEL